MDLSGAPILTRSERLVMRHLERKDVFIEKFTSRTSDASQHLGGRGHHRPTNSFESGFAPGRAKEKLIMK